ncbi:MAG: hypothetical protein ABI140_07120 [Jatrophihabitantaceae bacterium]
MKTVRMLTAGVISAGIALAGVVTAAPASAASATCGPIVRSADGHTASVHCYSAVGWTQFALRGQACNAGGCSTLTSSWTNFPGTASINAGSAYINQNTLALGFR